MYLGTFVDEAIVDCQFISGAPVWLDSWSYLLSVSRPALNNGSHEDEKVLVSARRRRAVLGVIRGLWLSDSSVRSSLKTSKLVTVA